MVLRRVCVVGRLERPKYEAVELRLAWGQWVGVKAAVPSLKQTRQIWLNNSQLIPRQQHCQRTKL